MRRILGIDPGLRVTGFGVLEARGNALVYIGSGCIRASGSSLPVRLGVIVRDLAHVIAEHRPTEVAVEKVFVNINPQSTLLLGQARGAAISAAVLRRAAGQRIHGGAGQAGGRRRGGAREAAGAGDGAAAARAARPARRRRRRCARRAICHAHASTGVGALARHGYRVRGGRLLVT